MLTTQAQRLRELEEILDLKAQGWSDIQIRKEMELDQKAYDARLKILHKSEVLKVQALNFVVETIHRLRWTRMKALTEYIEFKRNGANKSASSAMKRMIEIDVAIPKICDQLGWHVDDLEKYIKKGKLSTSFESKNEDDLYREYSKLIRSKS